MTLDPAALPDNPDALRAIIAALAAELAAAKAGLQVKALEIERMKLQLAVLRRQQFGSSSEKLTAAIAQLELALEELEADLPAEPAQAPADEGKAPDIASPATKAPRRGRQPLPDHLPRRDVIHPGPCACPACGGNLRQVGEDVTEILDYIPGRFEVIRHVRPALSCRACESMTQAPMPSLPIERGRPSPGLLAHVLVSKYADHLPLYRQAGIYAREGVNLDRSTLADWVGKAAALLDPLIEAILRHVLAGGHLHADDTPVPVLEPGLGRTRTGRLWVYLRDERPHGGAAPPAVFYRYSPDRKGEHPARHLAGFTGTLQVDGYAGFDRLFEAQAGRPARMVEAACWAHARRKIFDIHAATGSPIAEDLLRRIAGLYAVEAEARGQPPEARRDLRQAKARPELDGIKAAMEAALAKLSGRSDLAGAIRYSLGRWPALSRYLDDGRLAIDNNAAERAIRPLALGRKNWLFAGSDAGGDRAAALYSLIETAKLNGRDPEAYLREVLARIADHPINQIDALLPWNLAAAPALQIAA